MVLYSYGHSYFSHVTVPVGVYFEREMVSILFCYGTPMVKIHPYWDGVLL